MQNADNLCLKYLLNELEPSEIKMMERILEEDEDLLIEVESLRATLKKLDKLDEFEPPEQLCDSIVNKAAEYQTRKNNFFSQPAYNTFGSIVAAAFLLFIIFSFSDSTFFNSDDVNSSHTINKKSTFNAKTGFVNTQGEKKGTSQFTDNKVTPWIDNNEILRVEDKFNENRSSKFDSAMHNSFKKLVPVTYSTSTNQKVKASSGTQTPIHLTGSY